MSDGEIQFGEVEGTVREVGFFLFFEKKIFFGEDDDDDDDIQ